MLLGKSITTYHESIRVPSFCWTYKSACESILYKLQSIYRNWKLHNWSYCDWERFSSRWLFEPSLFNLVVNTFLKTIDSEKIRSMGYNCCHTFTPRHWFQFADDSALVTSTEEDSQALLNVFKKWCKWAGLKICPRKCKFCYEKMWYKICVI